MHGMRGLSKVCPVHAIEGTEKEPPMIDQFNVSAAVGVGSLSSGSDSL